MEFEISWVTAYGDDEGRDQVNAMLAERARAGWRVHTHSVVSVESTGQSEYVPQGHARFTHFFIFHR